MATKYDFNPREFLEPLQSQDGFSEANFLLNYQLLKTEYDKNGLLIHRFSFGEIALQFLKIIYVSYLDKDLLAEAEIRQSVDYIANELLENSIKYSDLTATKIKLEINVATQYITVSSTNLISENRRNIFLDYIREIRYSDPSELYIKQLEQSLNDNDKSGLGLLSIIHDYKAEISWKFTSTAHDFKVLSCVIVQLPINSI